MKEAVKDACVKDGSQQGAERETVPLGCGLPPDLPDLPGDGWLESADSH